MCRLCHLIQQAKNDDSNSIKEIIQRFDPKIKNTSKLVRDMEREDLEQELKIHVVKAIDKFKTADTPGFREFIDQFPKSTKASEDDIF